MLSEQWVPRLVEPARDGHRSPKALEEEETAVEHGSVGVGVIGCGERRSQHATHTKLNDGRAPPAQLQLRFVYLPRAQKSQRQVVHPRDTTP
eukprot:scaffold6068_cov119-Isochrysis_galbana.AAC.14